jgi:ATP-dependent Lon protease
MPGSILDALKKCGTNNCVIMLDEIDKVGRDSANGDPSAALLEVLDPAQNHAFRDHYLNIPFNLSKVLFITTANELGPIPRPLRDRMEIIDMSGYTVEEKIQIARRHLLPKQRKKHGLRESDIQIDESVIDALITGYTLESGVRELERQIAALSFHCKTHCHGSRRYRRGC